MRSTIFSVTASLLVLVQPLTAMGDTFDIGSYKMRTSDVDRKWYETVRSDIYSSFDKTLSQNPSNDIEIIRRYFENFERLVGSEEWSEIIFQGTIALKAAQHSNRTYDEAKICAQLTSSYFYLGDYSQALVHANRCHELAEAFTEPSLFIRALYLESAIHRAFAAKNNEEDAQQTYYLRAIEIANEALHIYSEKCLDDINLKGKIYFNLGAAHADNPKGDLEKATNCYLVALTCFQNANAIDDYIRTNIRLGKIYLLQKNYELSKKVIDEVRPQISNERLAMHADYLEAQIKFALNDFEDALRVARNGVARAEKLRAKEDKNRLLSLIEKIEEAQHHVEMFILSDVIFDKFKICRDA